MAPRQTATATPGRRARKKEETRRRIAEAAMALFLERGFDATTIDDITAAADVSKRSFFDYFPSKEDVFEAWQDGFTEDFVAEIAARPATETPAIAAERALVASISRHDLAEARAHARLRSETPALRAREQLKYEKMERAVTEALLKRPGAKRDPLQMHLVAMIVVGTLRVGSDHALTRSRIESPKVTPRSSFCSLPRCGRARRTRSRAAGRSSRCRR
jgi:AcrR family transcriptional regulator